MNSGKPFLIVVFFVILIALFAGGAMSDIDLTPNTPPSNGITGGAQSVMGVQRISNGICGGVYVVQSGDTLSRIAQSCGVPLQDLLAVNSGITNADLIRPGQKINLVYRITETPQPAPTGPTSSTAIPPAAPALIEPKASDHRPGGEVMVNMSGFAPNTAVVVNLGPVDGDVQSTANVQTDASGKLTLRLGIPATAKPGESWVVKVLTVLPPNIVISTPPFTIEK